MQTRIDLLAALYLVIPLALFFGDAFLIIPAIAIVGLIVFACMPLVRSCWRRPNTVIYGWKTVFILAVLACVWALLSGAGHVLYANSDWIKHDGVLKDLQHYQWPVTYGQSPSGNDVVLRYYMGFHVVPAFLAKVFGGLNFWVFIWEAWGAFLVLMILLRRLSTNSGRVLACVAFLFFGGMDVVGYIWQHGTESLHLNQPIDGWTLAQYNSNGTLLAWVPNHALAAWLALLLFKDRSRDQQFLLGVPLLLVAVAFWSIFVAVGLLPFVAVPLVKAVWNSRGRYVINPSVVAALVVAVVSAAFLLSGAAGGNRHGFLWDIYPDRTSQYKVLMLVLVDVVPLAIALLITRVRFEAWTWLALVLLCLYPFYIVGSLSSDFTMRASIPAQLALFLQVCVVIEARTRRLDDNDVSVKAGGAHVRPKGRGTWRFVPLALVLLVGAGGTVTTWDRAINPLPGSWAFATVAPSRILAVVGAPSGPPDTQYLAPEPSLISKALRHHAPVFNYSQVMNSNTKWSLNTVNADGAKLQQSNGVLTLSTKGAGGVIAATAQPLPPGTYQVRGRVNADPAHLPGFIVLRILNQNQLILPGSDKPGEWMLDDYVVVVGEGAPLTFEFIGIPDGGVSATLSDLTVTRVS